MVDLFVAGGIPAVMKMLGENSSWREPLRLSGMRIGDIIDQAEVKNPAVIPIRPMPLCPKAALLRCRLSGADGAVVKQSRRSRTHAHVHRPGRGYSTPEADVLQAIRNKTLNDVK